MKTDLKMRKYTIFHFYIQLSINLIFYVSELPRQDEAEESSKWNKWRKYKENRVEQPLFRSPY